MQAEAHTGVQLLEREFFPMRGVWLATAADVVRLGVNSLTELRELSAELLPDAYCCTAGRPFDVVMIPYFAALIDFAGTGSPAARWQLMRARDECGRQGARPSAHTMHH